MAANRVILILGAGRNIASSTAQLFASKGYKVALVSRGNSHNPDPSYLHIKGDLSFPETIPSFFEQVKKAYGSPPNVVVYNAAVSNIADPTDTLALTAPQITTDITVNYISTYIAAQEAVRGFASVPDDAPKSFIFTGNGLNTKPLPALVSNGAGKSATAHFLEVAVTAYKDKGYTFYYADERKSNGDYAYSAISGPGHAERYWDLSQDRNQQPWLHTFVTGEGYKKFH
ncbi:hypothetical protein FQN53_002846 [Emmonsiellopsis sp. PD_33]|nr:hypothetical protein FQN53_002846 [Emmonsiellopsis sp. PD_33]